MIAIDPKDAINGAFELVGALFTWRNALQLWRDRVVKGVYWPMFVFFALFGAWNLWFYPAVGCWLSFTAGLVLVSGNACWVALALWLRARTKTTRTA